MHISKKFFNDRWILMLGAVNAALMLLSVGSVVLRTDSEQSTTSIIAYRPTVAEFQGSGATSVLFEFAIFVVLSTAFFLLLSAVLYSHRRHIAISLLALNITTLLFTIVIFNALVQAR